MYDWANSAFATTVMAGFLSAVFQTVLERRGGHDEQLLAGARECPGQPGDYARLAAAGRDGGSGAAKKRWLLVFSLLGILTTGALALVAPGQWPVALLLYGLGAFRRQCPV